MSTKTPFHFCVEVFYRQVVIRGHPMVIWGRKWFFIGPTKFYYPCSYLTLSMSARPPGPKCHWAPRSNMTMWPWPSRALVTLCDQIGEKSLGQKIWSTHIFRDARIKLKTSRILTSILLSDPVRDQTSIFKVTSCLITSSKTQPKSTESRNFFADNEFSFFSLFFSKWIQNGASDIKNFCGLIMLG